MKQKGILGLVIVLLLAGVYFGADTGSGAGEERLSQEPDYLPEKYLEENERVMAEVGAEECFWCGLEKEGVSEGPENVAFISLNTFEIAYVEIHRYDDLGHRVEEPTGGTQVRLERGGEEGFSAFIFENTDRGFAEGTITLNQDAVLDMAKAAKYLCTECLAQLYELGGEEKLCGMGIIDFGAGILKPFAQDVGSFGLGDFYVFCDFREGKEMGFLVFYCPV